MGHVILLLYLSNYHLRDLMVAKLRLLEALSRTKTQKACESSKFITPTLKGI